MGQYCQGYVHYTSVIIGRVLDLLKGPSDERMLLACYLSNVPAVQVRPPHHAGHTLLVVASGREDRRYPDAVFTRRGIYANRRRMDGYREIVSNRKTGEPQIDEGYLH